MAATLFNMDSANLFVGDDDPSNSQFLTLKNIKVPSITEKTKEHTGGGASASIELATGIIEAPTLTFGLEGFNPDVMTRVLQQSRLKYTVRGNIRDVRSHEEIPLRAIVQGKMTKYEPSQFEKDSGMSSDYEIKEIVFYHLFFNNQEKIYFDYFAGPAGLRINGIPVQQARARNLGLA